MKSPPNTNYYTQVVPPNSVPVAKVEMTEVTALLDGVVQGLIENLNEATHTGKVFVHLSSCGKVAERTKNCAVVVGCTIQALPFTVTVLERRKSGMHLPYHPLHEFRKTSVCQRLVVEGD